MDRSKYFDCSCCGRIYKRDGSEDGLFLVDHGPDYDQSGDEIFDDESSWTEYDERVLQESWEMDAERDRDVDWARNAEPVIITVSPEEYDEIVRMLDEG